MNKPISLVLVDDDPSTQQGVVARIRALPRFRILAVVSNAGAVLETVRASAPDIVLLNLDASSETSLTLAGVLHGAVPLSRVIILVRDPARIDVASHVRAGVSGFLLASASPARARQTILSVANGIQVLPLELTRSLFGQLTRPGKRGRTRAKHTGALSIREREIADLIVQGANHDEIAIQLDIAPAKVTYHVHRVLSKLAVTNRLEVGAFSEHRETPFPFLPVPRSAALAAG